MLFKFVRMGVRGNQGQFSMGSMWICALSVSAMACDCDGGSGRGRGRGGGSWEGEGISISDLTNLRFTNRPQSL